MDKTARERQNRYREQITNGERKRLQVIISRDDASRLDEICSVEGIGKTEFVRRAIEMWSIKREDECPNN